MALKHKSPKRPAEEEMKATSSASSKFKKSRTESTSGSTESTKGTSNHSKRHRPQNDTSKKSFTKKDNQTHNKKKPKTASSQQKPKSPSTTDNNNSSNTPLRQRRHADIVNDAKIIWNKLRLKNNTPQVIRGLMDELMPLIKGKVKEIALQHDAARVVQAAIQFGTPKERLEVWKELATDVESTVEMCKSQYAHFVILKVIKYCHNDDACVKLLLKALKGNMPKLAMHAVASRVIEAIFITLTPKQTAALKQEFYGPHFALFAADLVKDQKEQSVPTLESNLKLAPEKKEQTLDFVRNLVQKGMEKSLYGLTFFQEFFADYLTYADSSEIRSLTATAADHVIHLLSSRAGTRVAAAMIAYGTAKDRKRIMKSCKGYTRSGLLHRDAYLAILRLVQLTDDTVSTQKNMLNELLTIPKEDAEQKQTNYASPILDIALSKTASKLLLMILVQDNETWKKCFDPYEHSLLFPNPTVRENGEDIPTSKKDDAQRRQELFSHLKQPLIELCRDHTDELLRSIPGSLVIREVYSVTRSEEVIDAVIKSCKDALHNPCSADDSSQSLFEDKCGHLAIKHLILSDVALENRGEPCLSSKFAEVFEARFMDICQTNRGAFVISALLKVPSISKSVARKLDKKKLLKLKEQAKGSNAGFDALLNEMK